MPITECRSCGASLPDSASGCPECGASSRPITFRFATGETIDGRYEVLNRIPGGGMAELYKVRHLHLQDIRAIKILRTDQIGDETYRKRFLREARIAASIKHPNVALLHDFATLPDNTFYMVEEFIEGTTLAKSLRGGRRFSLDEIADIAKQVLLGLGAIHERGIVHRDISHDNIMLAESTTGAIRVKIIDLGIARSIDATEAHSLTSAGLFIGKPHYASPEQMRLLEDDAPIDHRTDLYSLGVVLYEVVSGKVPFEASTPFAYLMKQLSGEVPKVDRDVSSMVPPDLENFIVTLLHAKREDRYQSTLDALRALSKIRVGRTTLNQEVPNQPQDPAAFPLSPPSKKRRQTAEVPIEQLQRLIERDRTESIRQASSVEALLPIEAEDPATQTDEFDDSRKITFVQRTPVPPTPKEVVSPDDVTEIKAIDLPSDDDEEPIAFVPPLPDTATPEPVLPPRSPDIEPPAAVVGHPSRRSRLNNPIVWFVAGIVFVAVVSLGGYLFYRVLEARFGGSAPEAPESPIEPATAEPGTDTGTQGDRSASPVEETRDGVPSKEPSSALVESETPPRVAEPGPSPRGYGEKTMGAKPEPPGEAPPPARQQPVTAPAPAAAEGSDSTPTGDVRVDDAAGASKAESPEPTTEEAPPPANAPVVLPGSTDDVREGDLVAPGPGVVAPKVIKTTEPIYPPLSENKGEQGVAMFSVLVGPDGSVEVVKLIVSTGYEPLDNSAEDAARQTVFSPATKNGLRVRMWKTLRFQFRKTKGY